MERDELIDGIHTLVSYNVIGDKQALSRYKGFRAELFFDNYVVEKYPNFKQFEGGIIISKDSIESSLINSVYISIIPKEKYDDHYIEIFKHLNPLEFKKMYLVIYSDSDWKLLPVMKFESEEIKLWVPKFEIFQFNFTSGAFEETSNEDTEITNFFESEERRGRNQHTIPASVKEFLKENLTQFTRNQILQIYMNRLFLDGYIGFGKKKGKPSDIDMIILNDKEEFRLVEIKEKDLPKFAKKGFGLDIPRLKDLLHISKTINLEYFLIIRHINNQNDRELLGWKYITVKGFADDVKNDQAVMGGTGMRMSNSDNPTLICSISKFRDL